MQRPSDPMERLLFDALTHAEIPFTMDPHPDNLGLDFYLPQEEVYVEVKQFHSDRIANQMARAPNVIALQGRGAVLMFCSLVQRPKDEK
ncbi:MAG: hypothetical protein MJH10_10155 [Epibacterium sp.]|nr:hypothetical protein [Epibacterium sp.]NQX73900.1 hypothetical protein [Epibacterium sp.]